MSNLSKINFSAFGFVLVINHLVYTHHLGRVPMDIYQLISLKRGYSPFTWVQDNLIFLFKASANSVCQYLQIP